MNSGKEIWIDIYKKDSFLNIWGKIFLFPLIVLIVIVWGLMDFLFTKKKNEH